METNQQSELPQGQEVANKVEENNGVNQESSEPSGTTAQEEK